jgi:hypothetical protein
MIGILAYGSLIVDPGWEIEEHTAEIIRPVETPFAVEYARRSYRTRAGAPTLVPVPEGKGNPVQAAVIVLKPGTSKEQARDILCRREIHRVGDRNRTYSAPGSPNPDRIVIGEIPGYAGLELLLFIYLGVNFPEILDDVLSDPDKAKLLSEAARDSLTEKTYYTCQDGIAYLLTAWRFGVETRLTELYVNTVLILAGGAPDLAEARIILARQKGLIE